MALIKKFRIDSYKEISSVIELKNISVFYNNRQIIENLNLIIRKQEILGMLGPNGVGKSTIFNLITGLKDPNYGEIIINGINSNKLPINERFTKFKLGLVPQYGGLIYDLTLSDNLKLVVWQKFQYSFSNNNCRKSAKNGRKLLVFDRNGH